ncbi:hypothetical protein QBC32DRAFT_68749 [Pseudoneurospora amorphoporcata]|uniref:Uncharacterized protein n=1 Tax=Pseudoneurospora amorphoporcata TaxID=241081 RepID=A0AAN6P1F2_9PEZI|nr:hypothetical protein QBC32DRAFT_68749 [Pseudoneurospora amorphoporcata]
MFCPQGLVIAIPRPQTDIVACVVCVCVCVCVNHRCLFTEQQLEEQQHEQTKSSDPPSYFPYFPLRTSHTSNCITGKHAFTSQSVTDRQVLLHFSCQRRFSSTSSYGGLDTCSAGEDLGAFLYCVEVSWLKAPGIRSRGLLTPVVQFCHFSFSSIRLPCLPCRLRYVGSMRELLHTLLHSQKKKSMVMGLVLFWPCCCLGL